MRVVEVPTDILLTHLEPEEKARKSGHSLKTSWSSPVTGMTLFIERILTKMLNHGYLKKVSQSC